MIATRVEDEASAARGEALCAQAGPHEPSSPEASGVSLVAYWWLRWKRLVGDIVRRVVHDVRFGQGRFAPIKLRCFARWADAAARVMDLEQPGLFRHIEIETISRCNATCSFCPTNKINDKRPTIRMADDLYRRIIDQLAASNFAGAISLRGNNEPLLDPDLLERVRLARQACPRAYIFFSTNGVLLDQAKAFSFIDAGLDLMIINNYSTKNRWHNNIAAIRRALAEPRHYRYAQKIRTVMRDAEAKLSNRAGSAPNQAELLAGRADYFSDSACWHPLRQMFVRPDGKVSLCMNDVWGGHTMGSVREQSLSEIWHGEKFANIRRDLAASGRSGIPVCRDCDADGLEAAVPREVMHAVIHRGMSITSDLSKRAR